MELTIAPQSYRPSADALIRAIKRASVILARMVSQETSLAGATAFCNPARPGVRCANHAADVNLVDGASPDDVLADIDTHFTGQGARCHVLDSADAAFPEAIGAAAAARGYRPVTKHLFLLEDSQKPDDRPSGVQIIPARAGYRELKALYRVQATAEFHADDRLADDFVAAMIDRLDEPRLELFLGRVDGKPAGVAGVTTLGQIGVISAAFSDPAFRGKGVGAALMRHTIEHCRRAQFEQVILDRSDGCPSIPFYERLGFQKAGAYVKYRCARG